ncbi:MAG TPA: hypothetical protein VE954_25875 [Oligoflexus sp.]|uniref:hypothetical protein n=1 Tax=Oligoflexus sp. TaxID=1971216 RepID=UPI002D6D2B37|nr:hypothetical protein [Oligoflexus sp.]HYX36552.1 hypothetical protein [Oligoflexus sp.]
MGRIYLVCLGLLLQPISTIQAQNAQSQPIVGPDGRNPTSLAPRPAQPSLEEQLRRKKAKDSSVFLPVADRPALSTDELLEPQERQQIEQLQDDMNLKDPDPRLRMHLGLAPTHAKTTTGPVDSWRFDPGIVWQAAYRLTDPQKSFTFWTGLHLASWYGTARSETSFSRFSVLYAGPLFAFEWRGKPRQTLAFGLAGFSRQADPEFPGRDHNLATRRFGLDGSGLWLNYGLGFRIAQGFEWETKIGLQSGASYLLSYASLGVSLWTD